MILRLGTNKIPGATLDSLSPLKSFSPAPAVIQRRVSENLDRSRKLNCCPECLQSYEQELAKLLAQDSEVQPGAAQSQLPRWLQNAKGPDDGVKTLNETQVSLAQLAHRLLQNFCYVTIVGLHM